ncbi:phage tail tube protein [Lacticaseibacillus yichunensis]|uniref:Phage tail tube protein n=1 Tax=Lacticaseibacillus yichunensis TaxID=2486015 RepID=A0ABW4CKM1_9LACO|nr:phage tail tube protein [Lacticaseibacillus yichunensis]
MVKMNLQRFAETADASQGLLSKGTTLTYTPHGGSGTATEITDISTVPEIGSDPEKVDVTTLADDKKKSIAGIQDASSLAFTAIYKGSNFKAVSALDTATNYDWTVTYPDGMTVTFTGQPSLKLSSAEVNGALKFTLTVVVSDGPDFHPVDAAPKA